ncbi:MAG: hypothetical protein GY927_02515 [bacterium]|nr:hypothetical protein [bacterium]
MKRIFGILFAVFLFPVLPNAASAAAAAPVAIMKVTLDVPLVINEKTKAVIIDKLTYLEKHRFVYLDLRINFSARNGGGAPFVSSVNVKGTPHGNSVTCAEIGPLPMGPGHAYSLGPIASYNHLLMTVYTGERAVFPYHDVSCEYTSSGSHEQFRIRGFFHILANSIPTAAALQLRPFNPPFAQAGNVLER